MLKNKWLVLEPTAFDFAEGNHLENHIGWLGHFIGSFSRCLFALKYSYNVLSMIT